MVEWRSFVFTLFFIVLCFVGIPIKIDKPKVAQTQLLFKSFLQKYNKTYPEDSSEFSKRFENFKEASELIQELNSQRSAPDSAIFGLTKYSDLSQDEFINRKLKKSYYKHLRKHRNRTLHHSFRVHHHNKIHKRAIIGTLPKKVDWRDKGVVTPVKNQKACGACWAFSVVETVETMVAIKTGQLGTLSIQQIIDCAKNGNLGCNGGDTCSLLEWLVDNNIKIEKEDSYPLVLKTEECKLNRLATGVMVASNFSCDYLVGNEEALMATLAYHGPVAVAVNALPWQFYLGGVIQYHCDGALTSINHAVQLVGYDTTAPTPHYIARNSWGTTFGEKGYLKLAIGGNICGVATEVSALDTL